MNVKSDKLLEPVYGGTTRQSSVYEGLKSLASMRPEFVLIHDAVRPLVDHDVISNVIATLKDRDGALPTIPVTDTLVSQTDGFWTGTIDRANLSCAQTPQAFRFEKIVKAHEAALAAGRSDFTDDSSLAEWFGIKVRIVDGSSRNIKLTRPEDFAFAEALLMQKEKDGVEGSETYRSIRVGNGFDVHAFEPGEAVILCGVSIPFSKRLKGHSDADVGLHAITDALFGALGDGDIGSHFPPSDPQWAGADSEVFLKHAGARVLERGGIIEHIDVTLICEAPKIGPHRDTMRNRISEILDVPVDRISVKATTSERLGFTGREEGIAAMASATVGLG